LVVQQSHKEQPPECSNPSPADQAAHKLAPELELFKMRWQVMAWWN